MASTWCCSGGPDTWYSLSAGMFRPPRRKDTDPQIRRTAISLLARSNNDRAKQLLKELIDK